MLCEIENNTYFNTSQPKTNKLFIVGEICVERCVVVICFKVLCVVVIKGGCEVFYKL